MKEKKPFYKTWWFLTLCGLLVIGAVGSIGSAGQPAADLPPGPESSLVEESAESPPKEEPEEPEEAPLDLDFGQLSADLKAELTDPEHFAYVRDVSVRQLDEGSLALTALLDDATDPEVAVEFADTLARRCNLLAAGQDSRIAPAEAQSYGGLYQRYDALVGVAPASRAGDPAGWYVYQAILDGTYLPLRLSADYEGASDPDPAPSPSALASPDPVDKAPPPSAGQAAPWVEAPAESQPPPQLESSAGGDAVRTVYWGDTGTKIHTNPNCRTLTGNVHSGTEAEAVAAGRTEGYCKVC